MNQLTNHHSRTYYALRGGHLRVVGADAARCAQGVPEVATGQRMQCRNFRGHGKEGAYCKKHSILLEIGSE